jgi:hypothetical protein
MYDDNDDIQKTTISCLSFHFASDDTILFQIKR